MALLIKTDGTRESVSPKDGAKKFTLEELQALVEGYIQVVPGFRPPGQRMLVNEEGLLRDLRFNLAASELARQQIVGNAVVIGDKEWE